MDAVIQHLDPKLHSRACPICEDPVDLEASHCTTCGSSLTKPTMEWRGYGALMLTLAALVLYIPANMMPFMTFEMYGQKNSATIWSGVVSLYESGSSFIALVVFLASMVVPLFKLICMFLVMVPMSQARTLRRQTALYHVLEKIGPWSMLDIFLVAVFVAIIKLGAMGTVNAEAGSVVFLMVVLLTLLASQLFHPSLIWRNYDRSQKT